MCDTAEPLLASRGHSTVAHLQDLLAAHGSMRPADALVAFPVAGRPLDVAEHDRVQALVDRVRATVLAMHTERHIQAASELTLQALVKSLSEQMPQRYCFFSLA